MRGGCGNLENAGCVATSCVGVSPADETSLSRVSAVTATLVRFLSAQCPVCSSRPGGGVVLVLGWAAGCWLVVTAVNAAHARAGQTRKVGSVP